jgi:hypothetical protein
MIEDVDASDGPDAPVVKLINGIDAATFVQNLANSAGGSQDPDASYNTMFFSRSLFAAGSEEGLFHLGGRHQ